MQPVNSATTPVAGAQSAANSEADWDRLVVERVQQGEVAAFDLLIKKYRERLFGVVYNLTSNREDASDLVQEAFIKAFRSINRFKGKSAFFTWLYRIAVNTTITHLKKHRARRFFSFENLDEEVAQADIVEILAAKNRSDKPTLLNELQEKLNEALQTLSLKHRTVVVLFEIEGLSHQEIAGITGTSEGTVRSRLHYAKQQLQSILRPYID
ncbi:MAG: sigma-70 family RNA polymerase sigma factor [Verrucomicrobiota bacterium]